MSLLHLPRAAALPGFPSFGRLRFEPPRVARRTLSNGLPVWLVRDNTLPVVHLTMYFRAGSASDPAGREGLAHLCAPLLRDGGSAAWPAEKADEKLEYLGAEFYVHSYTEETHAELTALSKDLDAALAVFADALARPVFEEEKTAVARAEALELIRRRNDYPAKTALREARRALFGAAHPYGRRPEEASVAAATRAELAAFHSAFFRPDNAALAASGDFRSDEEALEKLEKAFGSWRPGAAARPPVPPPAHSGGRRILLADKPAAQAEIAILQRGPRRVSPEQPALALLCEALGGGFESRLFSEVRSRLGLAYSVSAYPALLSEGGFLATSCGTAPGTAGKALAEIFRQLERAGREPLPEDELERAKNSVINPFVFKFSTPHRLAAERALEEFHGFGAGYLDRYVDSLALTDAAAAQGAGRLFDPADAVVCVVGDAKTLAPALAGFGAVEALAAD